MLPDLIYKLHFVHSVHVNVKMGNKFVKFDTTLYKIDQTKGGDIYNL